jgi:hypothetical protein
MYATMRNIRLYGAYGGYSHDFRCHEKKERRRLIEVLDFNKPIV